MALTLTLIREGITTIADAAGDWAFERGRVLENQKQIGNFASTRRLVLGTDAHNTAMLTLTIFFLGQQPPENITLQGNHDVNFNSGIGSVSAASAAFASLIGKHFSQVGDTLRIQ